MTLIFNTFHEKNYITNVSRKSELVMIQKNIIITKVYVIFSCFIFGATANAQETIPSAFNGIYFGGTLGYGFGDGNFRQTAPLVGPIQSLDTEGKLGGAFFGYNHDFGNNIVVGIEGGVDFSLESFGGPIPAGSALWDPAYLVTVGPRIGYTFDNTLLFFEGGLAIGRGEIALPTSSERETHTGFYLGAGVDYALTDNIFVGLKYNYADLGDQTYSFPAAGGLAGNITDPKYHLVKARFGWKF